MRVHHIALRVRDLEASANFYANVLGLPRKDAPRPGVVWFGMGDALLMLEPRESSAEDSPEPGIFVLALSIGAFERDTRRDKLVAHGVVIERESAYSIYVRDPDGNRIALSHYPETPFESIE